MIMNWVLVLAADEAIEWLLLVVRAGRLSADKHDLLSSVTGAELLDLVDFYELVALRRLGCTLRLHPI